MARPAKFDDDDLVDRATDLFWQRGSDVVSVRDLETALELRAPSIYRRFHSKDRLLVRCIDRYVDRVVGGRVRFFLDSSDDPLNGLRAFFSSVLEPHRGEQRLRGCLLTTTAGHADAKSPEIKRAINRGFSTIEAAFRRQAERAAKTGHINVDPEATAKALLLSYQGLLVLARSGASDLQTRIDATFQALAPTA